MSNFGITAGRGDMYLVNLDATIGVRRRPQGGFSGASESDSFNRQDATDQTARGTQASRQSSFADQFAIGETLRKRGQGLLI